MVRHVSFFLAKSDSRPSVQSDVPTDATLQCKWPSYWLNVRYLLTGQLLSELGLLLLHAAQLLLLVLQAELHLRRLAAVGLRSRGVGGAGLCAASEPPRAHHVAEQRPLGSRRAAAKVKRKRRSEGI